MKYDPAIMKNAMARLEKRKKDHETEYEERRRYILANLPELAEIEQTLRSSSPRVIRDCLIAGTDPTIALKDLRARNAALRLRESEILAQHGFAPDALSDTPLCPACHDSGWVGSKMCDCLHALCAEEQVRSLSSILDIGSQTFESFCIDWYSPLPYPGESYSPRENMRLIYDFCKNYANTFGRCPYSNLFLTGSPGLGKTFLSACIAKVVARMGASVVYDTAINIFSQFEDEKFSKPSLDRNGETPRQNTNRYLNCELLILDDLGSEMLTPIVQSSLYTLINTRSVRNKKTIISSNLSISALNARYSGQITSRIEGEYSVLRFYGEDIRMVKKQGPPSFCF